MKKLILFIAVLVMAITSSATVHNISTSGLTYTPATVNASVGDTVAFSITSNHPTVQVSEATWNAAGTTPLAGGFGTHTSNFQIILTAADMPTIWYVCTNHVGSGMKGIINVANVVVDTDSDGIEDDQDNCPTVANADQADLDTDGEGDACDDDIDGDGVDNADDAFPMDANETLDTDQDGIGNNADTDDDDDGCSDADEIINGTDPLDANDPGDCLVGVYEVANFGRIEIYPLPASDELNIITAHTIESILIIDIAGKIVHEWYPLSTKVNLDVSTLKKGAYFLQIKNIDGNTAIKRIAIKE